MNKVYAKNNYRIKVDYSEEIQSITLKNKLRNRRKILIEPRKLITNKPFRVLYKSNSLLAVRKRKELSGLWYWPRIVVFVFRYWWNIFSDHFNENLKHNDHAEFYTMKIGCQLICLNYIRCRKLKQFDLK